MPQAFNNIGFSPVSCIQVTNMLAEAQKSSDKEGGLSQIDTNLIQVEQQLEIKNQAAIQNKNGMKAENQAKWGFLKNIVNIDTFFSSGAEAK